MYIKQSVREYSKAICPSRRCKINYLSCRQGASQLRGVIMIAVCTCKVNEHRKK